MLDLGSEFAESQGAGADELPTWVLLQRIEAELIYAELSLPRGSSGGKISEWQERIILAPIDRVDGRLELGQPDSDESTAYSVDVERR